MGDRPGVIVAVVAALSLAAAVAVGVALYGELDTVAAAWARHLQDEAGEVVDRPGEDGAAGGVGAMLLAVAADDGSGAAFAVLSRSGDDPALLTVLPAALYDVLPGSGIFPLGDALRFGGLELAVLAVENTMGIDVGPALLVTSADLPQLVGEEMAVDLPNPLLVAGDDGAVVRVAAEGDLLRTPEVVAQLFTERGSGDLLALLERQVAAWQGLLRRAGGDSSLRGSLAALAGDGEVAASLLSSPGMEVTLLPVGQTGSGDSEGFEPRADEIASLVERRLGSVATWSGERPRVEILNGNGRLATTRHVAGILIGDGFRVVRTDNAESFAFATTVVLAQGDANTDLGRRVVGLLGTGELRLEAEAPSGIVDVSIIVGHDIPTGEG